MNTRSVFLWSTALLLCTTIVTGYYALYFSDQAQRYKRDYERLSSDLESLTMVVSLKLEYGNGTVRWFNSTRVPLNSTLLTVTKMLVPLRFSVSEFGAFVTEIDGVCSDNHNYWGWSYWDRDQGGWAFGQVGSDKWVLHNGDLVSWTYTYY